MLKQFRHSASGLSSEQKYERTQSAFLKETTRLRAAKDEKTARLRALRLAKESKERPAAAQSATESLPD